MRHIYKRYKKLVRHIKRICKNKELQLTALCFCVDMINKNKEKTFVREDFETLNIDGKEVEQDVVKEIFKNKNSATYEEVFNNIFKNNIKHIKLDRTIEDCTEGTYDHVKKEIKVKDYSYLFYFVKSNRQRIKDLKNYLKNNYVNTSYTLGSYDYKNTIYHELGHVLERKSFKNEKYIQVGINDEITTFVGGNIIYYPSFTFETIDIKKLYRARNDNLGMYYLDSVKKYGSEIISEIFNHEFTYLTENTYKISNSPIISKNSGFKQKKYLQGVCSYNMHYDIVNYINLLCMDLEIKEVKFNSKPIINKLKNLTINTSKLNKYKNCFKSELSKDLSYRAEFICNYLNNAQLDPYELLSTLIGKAHYNHMYKHDKSTYYFKVLSQSILIEGIKNEWLEKLNDNNVEKNLEFFIKLNHTLKTIDDYILYPNNTSTYYKKDNYLNKNFEINESDLNKPIKDFAITNPELLHFIAFNDFIEEVKCHMKLYKDKITNLENVMNFIKDQQTLDKKHINLLRQTSSVLREVQKNAEEKRNQTVLSF